MSDNVWRIARALDTADRLDKGVKRNTRQVTSEQHQIVWANGEMQLRVHVVAREHAPDRDKRSQTLNAFNVLEQFRKKIESRQVLTVCDERKLAAALNALFRAGLISVAQVWAIKLQSALNRARHAKRIDSAPSQENKQRYLVQVSTNNDPTKAVQGAGIYLWALCGVCLPET